MLDYQQQMAYLRTDERLRQWWMELTQSEKSRPTHGNRLYLRSYTQRWSCWSRVLRLHHQSSNDKIHCYDNKSTKTMCTTYYRPVSTFAHKLMSVSYWTAIYTVSQKNCTPTAGRHKFIKISSPIMIFHTRHCHSVADWLSSKSLVRVE